MPSRNELLADHYVRVARIGAVCIDVNGSVELFEIVGVEIPVGLAVLCCSAGEAGRIAGLVSVWPR
jgi:hypothetical protein